MICVHLFPAMMMTELRCSYGVRIPTYFVATDFTCSPGGGSAGGRTVHPHRDLIPEFVTAGLPQERLFPPASPLGGSSCIRRAGRRPAVRWIFRWMAASSRWPAAAWAPDPACHRSEGSGAHGAGGSAGHHLRQQPPDVSADAERFLPPVDRVRVLGYTHEMFRYMYASDLLLTKAGGLTTAEAVAAGTPLLYPTPSPAARATTSTS